MKRFKSFFVFALTAVAVLLSACDNGSDPDDPDTGNGTAPTAIVLNKSTLTLTVGGSETLVATLVPVGSTGTVTWESSNEAVATVSQAGAISAIAEGKADIIARCGELNQTCALTVNKKVDGGGYDPKVSLSGSNYYVIVLDGTSYSKIESKVVADYRVDDVNKFLYYWGDPITLEANATSGLNFYNLAEGWTSVTQVNPDWCGAGFFVGSAAGPIDMTDITKNIDDYYFHIGIKSDQTDKNFCFTIPTAHYNEGTGKWDGQEGKLVIGPRAWVDAGVTYQPYKDIPRDGEWHEIEVPMSYFQNQGLFYTETPPETNVFSFLCFDGIGSKIEIDAVFIYKKAK